MGKMYEDFREEEFLGCVNGSGFLWIKNPGLFTGMKVKLKVLCAFAHHPRLLILDEPTAGLDVVAREEILDMIREYMEEGERSVLISSHISSDLERLCDDFYLIQDGRIVLHEETDVPDERLRGSESTGGPVSGSGKAISVIPEKGKLRVQLSDKGKAILSGKLSADCDRVRFPDQVMMMAVKGERV